MKSAFRQHARCAGAGASSAFVLAGTERHYERSRPFAISHLALDLRLDFDNRAVVGTARLRFSRVAASERELCLDALGFEQLSVRLIAARESTASDAEFDYDGDRIAVRIPESVTQGTVEIRYRAQPRRGLYFLGPDAAVPDRPVQVWSQCQDEDARHWFPCHDKPHVKMTTELRVEVPNGFTALSNGQLVESKRPRGAAWSYSFRLEQPQPSYLLTLVAGKFAVVDDRPARVGSGSAAREVPVSYYVPADRKQDCARSFGETPRMIELFSRLTGVSYPYPRYTQVVVSDFIFGGMENTTATTMYEHILLDERAALDISSNELVAHELAHQWFGDYVTCRDWSHAWLNEGFATFFEHLEREDRLGREEYDYGIAADQHAYLGEADGRYARAIVCRDYEAPIDLFDRHLYEKGSLVLHMLRRTLGDAAFWKGVGDYLAQHEFSIVETNDLQRALEAVSGRSLERFFDQWVYRPGHPVLKVKVTWEDGLLTASVTQKQKAGETAVFAFEFEIEVCDESGRSTRHMKTVSERSDALVLPLPARPRWVAFDPEMRVIGDVSLEVPAEMLRRQLEQGPSARIRWAAAEALGRRDDPPTIVALGACLKNEQEAWMVRVEAAEALGKIRSDASYAALLDAATSPHPKVRRAAVAAMGQFRTVDACAALGPVLTGDPSYLVQSEAARAMGRTRQREAYPALLEAIDQPSWAHVVQAGCLDGLAALRDEQAIEPVAERTRYGVPTRARRAAIWALARLSDTRKVREQIEDLLDDGDPHLRIDATLALEHLADPRARGALRRRLERELDGRVARRLREALRDLGAEGRKGRTLSDDVEALKNDFGEVKARLSKLEAARGERPVHARTPPKPKKNSTRKPRRGTRSRSR
jgi:aminopeptidase N